jgi:hypothetical protein
MNKSNTIKKKYKKHKKTRKNSAKKKFYLLPNLNPNYINDVSMLIYQQAPHNLPPLVDSVLNQDLDGSYSPTVNKDLVLLQSMSREKIIDCNNDKAFNLQEPLKIGIPGNFFGNNCIPYYEPKAIKFLLKNLSANKHIKIENIVPPIQSQSNCWFNTMFVTLFISDKGRKFFHFFRQLMIEGKQSNGKLIPSKLKNSFALLNYAIDACLTGNKYAYILDTNAIIQLIYENIPESYKKKLPYLTNVGEAGNPIRYYGSLINYLNNTSIQLIFIKNTNDKWKDKLLGELNNNNHLPHLIILEFYDGSDKTPGPSGQTTNKPRSFFIKGAKYTLDSCVIRDTTQQHFSANLTCENKEFAYDGMSFHRLVPMDWKKYINSDYSWGFEGSNNIDGSPLKWNFSHGYQMLIYYRVK